MRTSRATGISKWLAIGLCVCALGACKEDLYSKLTEADVNDMLAPREVVAFTTVLLYFFRRFSLFVLSIIRISINTIITIIFFSSNYYHRHCNIFIVMVTVANGIRSECVLVISSQLEIRY